jgi:hypothetical protein
MESMVELTPKHEIIKTELFGIAHDVANSCIMLEQAPEDHGRRQRQWQTMPPLWQK